MAFDKKTPLIPMITTDFFSHDFIPLPHEMKFIAVVFYGHSARRAPLSRAPRGRAVAPSFPLRYKAFAAIPNAGTLVILAVKTK